MHEKCTDDPTPDKQLRITDNESQPHNNDELLSAIGGVPEILDLRIDVPGVRPTESGHVAVEKYQDTNGPGHICVGRGDRPGRADTR